MTFGALVAIGGLQGGAERKRNTRQVPGRDGPSFLGLPFSQRPAPFGALRRSFTQQGGSEARSSAFVRRTLDLGALNGLNPSVITLLRTGDGRLPACMANPGRRFPAHRTHSRSACVAVLAGPAPPSPPPTPLSNGSAVLRIQGHYIWLQSSFMRLLGC